MKIKLSKSTRYEPEWMENRTFPPEERCYVMLRPLETGDMIVLMDVIQQAGLTKANADGKVQIDGGMMGKVVGDMSEILKKYATIHNLEDADGPVDINAVVGTSTYMGLAFELMMQLANVSMPSEQATKNLSPPPA